MRLIGLAVVLAVGLFVAPLAAAAQLQSGNVHRIGLLGAHSLSAQAKGVEALRAGLRDLGYVAAKHATTTIPIVMTGVGDAVGSGLVASLARPGGNITGLTDFVPELMAKRLELLKEAMPRTGRVAVLFNPANRTQTGFKPLESTARLLKVELQPAEVLRPDEFERAFSTMAESRVDAVVVAQDAFLNANVKVIADLAAKKRLPSSGTKDFAEAGGVIGYGWNPSANNRRAAHFVDRILKGAKPADLPVERPTKFELIINMKTAKALGLTIPQSILLRADQIIQ